MFQNNNIFCQFVKDMLNDSSLGKPFLAVAFQNIVTESNQSKMRKILMAIYLEPYRRKNEEIGNEAYEGKA